MGHEQAKSSLFEHRHRTPDGRSRGAAPTSVRAANSENETLLGLFLLNLD